jgi:hypothetical protein
MEDLPYYFIEGTLYAIREKAILVDKQWYPISQLEYGKEDFWKVGDHVEISVAEWFLIENEII